MDKYVGDVIGIPTLVIPIEPILLADVLDRYSTDWKVVLDFLLVYAKVADVEMDSEKITLEVKKLQNGDAD